LIGAKIKKKYIEGVRAHYWDKKGQKLRGWLTVVNISTLSLLISQRKQMVRVLNIGHFFSIFPERSIFY